ncbi:MAG: 2-phospho-L-lactate transferase [Burkholderiales bacterium]
MSTTRDARPVLALSGGIGGAKLALGLSRVLPDGALTVLANVGDDFEHLGLAICPDIDTLLYTLAGLADPERGWGRRDETWHFMAALEALGGPAWFRLGDADLALHVERTRRLAEGATLREVTETLRRRLGVASRILPASDDPVRTRLHTSQGWLPFQDYFVARRCEPAVDAIEYAGAEHARACDEALAMLRDPDLRAVVICPSNPLLSIEPMLAIPALREALRACAAPVIAVSPIVRGMAIKGPTAKLLGELGWEVDALTAARRYGGLLHGYVIDEAEEERASEAPLRVVRAPTVMHSLDSKERLAQACLDLADAIVSRQEAAETAS